MRTSFSSANTESDVEKQFIFPLLTNTDILSIPHLSILSQESIAAYEINKGGKRKTYKPDFIVYCDGIPVFVIEAKEPSANVTEGFAEAQLYAHQLNNHFRSGTNPASIVLCTNGRDLLAGAWDTQSPIIDCKTSAIRVGSEQSEKLRRLCGWDALQEIAGLASIKLANTDWFPPASYFGENRVTLAKVGHNSLYTEVDPILHRYFNPTDEAAEAEIVEKAYVSSDDITKYEKTFETFLRSRVVPISDANGLEIKTTKRDAHEFTQRIVRAGQPSRPYMQLIIGGVGSGKTTFLKRYFRHLVPDNLKNRLAYCRIDLNEAPDDLSDLDNWICERFIELIRLRNPTLIDIESEQGLRAIFSAELKNNKGAYEVLRKASEEKLAERVGSDLLGWMQDKALFAKAIARMIGGDKGLHVIVALDNVDRRDRESQLKIFQTGQWFMALIKATTIMTLRDETYEAYRDEKPLDAFPKTGNFYIRPPRFVDMVARRLDLAIASITSDEKYSEYDVPGLGKVRYPNTALGNYLTAVYVDLFRRKRNITLILEALAGKNARRALEMLTAVLTSAHFDTRDFTTLIASSGGYRIQESILLKALMRTNYLYFTPSHGFVKNIYDYPRSCENPSHFIKMEIIKFLVDNRKTPGDINIEGYFTVDHMIRILSNKGYSRHDVFVTINALLKDELIISDNLTKLEASLETAIRIHPSGYIHMRILSARTEYIAAAALVTPVNRKDMADQIAKAWLISPPRTDIPSARKREVSRKFIDYLAAALTEQRRRTVGLAESELAGTLLVRNGTEAVNSTSGFATNTRVKAEDEFQRLFDEPAN